MGTAGGESRVGIARGRLFREAAPHPLAHHRPAYRRHHSWLHPLPAPAPQDTPVHPLWHPPDSSGSVCGHQSAYLSRPASRDDEPHHMRCVHPFPHHRAAGFLCPECIHLSLPSCHSRACHAVVSLLEEVSSGRDYLEPIIDAMKKNWFIHSGSARRKQGR